MSFLFPGPRSLMDESPRWLIVRGFHDQAMQVLRKAARWNRISLPPEDDLRALMNDIQEEVGRLGEGYRLDCQ